MQPSSQKQAKNGLPSFNPILQQASTNRSRSEMIHYQGAAGAPPRAASGSAIPLAPLGDLEKKHMSRLE